MLTGKTNGDENIEIRLGWTSTWKCCWWLFWGAQLVPGSNSCTWCVVSVRERTYSHNTIADSTIVGRLLAKVEACPRLVVHTGSLQLVLCLRRRQSFHLHSIVYVQYARVQFRDERMNKHSAYEFVAEVQRLEWGSARVDGCRDLCWICPGNLLDGARETLRLLDVEWANSMGRIVRPRPFRDLPSPSPLRLNSFSAPILFLLSRGYATIRERTTKVALLIVRRRRLKISFRRA